MPSSSSLPEVLPWKARLKSAYPLPGGDRSYLDTLRRICRIVDQLQPSKGNLISSLESELAFEAKNSQYIVSFLLRTDLLKEEAGHCHVGCWTRRWLDNDDAGFAIALIHSRVRFIGEMLAELQTAPHSLPDLLSIANEKYGFGWKTAGSISNRRGWLQSAGFIEIADRKLTITEAGRTFLTRLGKPDAPPPPIPTPPPQPDPPPEPAPRPEPGPDWPPIDDLATEIEESSTDSQNPGRFERAVHNAFAYLGFRSKLLGGSGKTDVLLHARLGRSDSYKATVDAKTTASGRLSDIQVDWATLAEHRTNERADHSLLVGPDPSGSRLFDRAVDYGVTVLSAQRLADLCRHHARTPLGLDDYRLLFSNHGEADLTQVKKRTDSSERLLLLTADIYRILADRWDTVGYHTARDLWMLLPDANPDIIQSILDTLASPLVGAIHGDPRRGYVLATDPKVVQLRLTLLGEELTHREEPLTRKADRADSPLGSEEPLEEKIQELIAGGESGMVEFKSTGRKNLHTNKKDPAIEWSIVKSIAAFMNTDGGELLIGVGDLGQPVGIEGDYPFVKSHNRDGWELWLGNLISTTLGNVEAAGIKRRYCKLDGKTVAYIKLHRASKAVFATPTKAANPAKENFSPGKYKLFYIRMGNATQELVGDELIRYTNELWPP